MRWPWRRRRDEPGVDEARQKLIDARNRLAATQMQGAEVSEVAESLRELRQRNHFGPMITQALRGHR